MCSRHDNRAIARSGRFRAAFTLLEVMLAVGILGMIALGIHRFVSLSLQAIQVSTEQQAREVSMRALMKVLQAQMNDLPRMQAGVLLGDAHQFNNLRCDEMQWICGAGNSMFTMHAAGDYKVTLALKPLQDGKVSVLGLRRLAVDNNKGTEANWLPLMAGVKAMEIRYFDPRLNAWLEKWTNQVLRPNLVRLRIWRVEDETPYERILSLPSASSAT